MGARFLVDSNAIIELLAGQLPPATNAWPNDAVARRLVAYSVINRIEVLSWPEANLADMQAATEWLAANQELPLSNLVAVSTINLRRSYRRKLPDAVIAATALVHQLPVITRDGAGFRAIAGLVVFDPHDPAALPAL